MLFVLAFISVFIRSELNLYHFKEIKNYFENFADNEVITDSEKKDALKAIDDLELKAKKAMQKLKRNQAGNTTYLENIIGYTPLAKENNFLTIVEVEKKRKKAIKLLSEGNFEQAYKKFYALSEQQSYDPFSNYYWMGVIKLKQKKFAEAILHFAQFYKSMILNKENQLYKTHIDKMPRSVLNILECLYHLNQKEKSIQVLDLFNTQYLHYRKSVHENYIVKKITKSDD